MGSKPTYPDEQILSALLSFGSVRKASEQLGCSRSVIYKRLEREDFKQRYKALQGAIVDGACADIISALTDAIEALHAIVVSGSSDNAKISASDALLRHGIRYLEISNLLERLNRLEKQIGGDVNAV